MYYPYEENAAGELRSRHVTSKVSEYLLASKEIIALAQELLSEDACIEAERLATMLAGTRRQKNTARQRLIAMVSPPPKRPMYYCQHEVQFLPRWTRNTLRYLGDLIDMLVKAASYEKTRDNRIFTKSLGLAINIFAGYYSENSDLAELLKRYNNLLYRESKHDFKLPISRKEHRFTSREVVLSIFITTELVSRIMKISRFAEHVMRDEPFPEA